MILTKVSNFRGFPDGRLRAGPFTCSRKYLAACMRAHELHIDLDDGRALCSQTMRGMMVSAAGPGVHGYLLDTEGIEAPSTVLEAFLEDVVPADRSFVMEGHYCPDSSTMITSHLRAWWQAERLFISAERILETADGGRTLLHRQVPAAGPVQGHVAERRLALVG